MGLLTSHRRRRTAHDGRVGGLMETVSWSTIAQWYGPSCNVPIETVRVFGHDVPLHKDTHRVWLRLDKLFREFAPKYYKNDICNDPIDTWGYACRPVRGGSSPSIHSYGCAL